MSSIKISKNIEAQKLVITQLTKSIKNQNKIKKNQLKMKIKNSLK